MLNKVGAFTFPLESYMCDFTGKPSISVVSNFILQAATIHASERGFGFEQIAKDNVAWVLSRFSIEMTEYPERDQNFTVETWVENVARFFTQRCFRFLNHEGKVIGYARTIWAAIDMQTRRPVDIPAWRPDLADYIVEEKECPIVAMPKLPAVEGVEPSIGYAVRYSDMDINKHMNSVKYIEHVLNVFDLEIFKEKIIARFDIVYLAEGHFGDKLKLYKQDVADNEFVLDTKKGDESICRSRIIWK
jgi:acyl-ACP thioesterase